MDVQIPKGKITSIIGPNGCGKSTLLKALSRMMPVQNGTVLLDGEEIAKLPTVEVARRMASLPGAALMHFPAASASARGSPWHWRRIHR